MNGGKIIAQVLKATGIRHLFTLSGGHIAPIYVEAEREGIRVIDVRHEATTVFAADALARLTGIPGAAAVTAGPGVTNTITALKNAQMAQSPVLLLGGATATLLRGRGALQDIDQLSIIRSVVKRFHSVSSVKQFEKFLQEELMVSISDTPGPVFLECPVDLLYPEEITREWYGKKTTNNASLKDKLITWYINRHLNKLFQKTDTAGITKNPLDNFKPKEASEHIIRRAADSINQAQRPVMLIGSGSLFIPSEAIKISDAVKTMGIPVYLSGMARGLLGHHHSLHFHHHRKKALRESDCIILAGVPADFRLDYGSHFNRHAKLIAINRNPAELKKNIHPALAIHGDPGRVLQALATKIKPLSSWENWKKILTTNEEIRETEISEMAKTKMSDGINPITLFRILENLLPQNSIIIADGGDFAATAAYTLHPRKPLGWIDPGVFGTLGAGGGYALAAGLHHTDDYIWIIYGDGSAAYSLMEFDTFCKMKLKICAIVGNNGSWEQIARDQVTILGSNTATVLPQSDYHLIPAAFGGAGEKIENTEETEAAINRAIESMNKGVPYLINVMIGKSDFRKGSISM